MFEKTGRTICPTLCYKINDNLNFWYNKWSFVYSHTPCYRHQVTIFAKKKIDKTVSISSRGWWLVYQNTCVYILNYLEPFVLLMYSCLIPTPKYWINTNTCSNLQKDETVLSPSRRRSLRERNTFWDCN